MMMADAARPATLKVLLGEVQVTVFAQILSDRDAMGMWIRPSKTISPWISSETISTSFFRQIFANLSSSSFLKHLPVGFWGLQNIHTLALLAFFSKSSKSGTYLPSFMIMGFSKTFLPFCSMVSKNGE